MSLHEECGVFGVIAPEPCDVASISYYGLYALQHRGQESCGIVVNDDGVFVSHKDLGLVSEVFSQDILSDYRRVRWQLRTHGTVRQAVPIEITANRLKSITKKAEWRLLTTAI